MKAPDKAEHTKSFSVSTAVEPALSIYSLPDLEDINRREPLPFKSMKPASLKHLLVVISVFICSFLSLRNPWNDKKSCCYYNILSYYIIIIAASI